MKYKCKENDGIIEMKEDKEELLISIDGEKVKTVIGLKDLNAALILFDVSQQRELLKSFQEFYQKGDYNDEYPFDENINRFLKAFNCG